MLNTPFDLSGHTALVTGASSGLGQHFAHVLAGAGAKVALAARRSDRLKKAVEKIESNGGAAIAVPLDVTDPEAVAPAFDSAEEALGPVTILVTAAGVATTVPFDKMSDDDWRFVMDANVDGVFRTAREGAARMKANGKGGAIITVASILAYLVQRNLSAYAASKAAVNHLTRAMALDLARANIRVNAIAPGYFSTEMNDAFLASDAGQEMISTIPQARVGEPHELDGALLLLASDAGSFITGATIPVDGGALLSLGY